MAPGAPTGARYCMRVPSRFEVYVVPRSTRPGPDGRHGGLPRLRVSSPPVEGRANAEVERLLREALGAPVRVVRGERGRVKLAEADLDPETLARRLSDAFGA